MVTVTELEGPEFSLEFSQEHFSFAPAAKTDRYTASSVLLLPQSAPLTLSFALVHKGNPFSIHCLHYFFRLWVIPVTIAYANQPGAPVQVETHLLSEKSMKIPVPVSGSSEGRWWVKVNPAHTGFFRVKVLYFDDAYYFLEENWEKIERREKDRRRGETAGKRNREEGAESGREEEAETEKRREGHRGDEARGGDISPNSNIPHIFYCIVFCSTPLCYSNNYNVRLATNNLLLSTDSVLNRIIMP